MRRFMVGICLLALALVTANAVLATKPASEHKVTICHAIPPDTAKNGWIVLTADIAANGHLRGGHDTQHDADIIPPYTYHDFSYPGKNWDTTGQGIYNNGCKVPVVEPTPTPVIPTPTPPRPTPTIVTVPEDNPVMPPTDIAG